MKLVGRDLGCLDADSHFQEPVSWLADTDVALARRCSGMALLVGMANFVGIDPYRVPETPFWSALARWAAKSSLADTHALAEDEATAGFFSTEPFDADARTQWLDQNGIDHQVCNPTVATQMHHGTAAVTPSLAPAVAQAFNEWAASATSSSSRLHATALVDLSDTREASPRFESLADSGSLTYLLPIDEAVWSLGNEPLVRLASDARAHGLAAVMHLGVTLPSATAPSGSLPRWADSQLRAQRCLLGWVASHWDSGRPVGPVLVQELGIDWAVPWLRNLQRCEATPVLSRLTGPCSTSLSAAARNNVAWIPLPRDPIEEVLASWEAPQLLFGSDFPHSEGWGDHPLETARKRGWDPSTDGQLPSD
jgi:hypothetical protein